MSQVTIEVDEVVPPGAEFTLKVPLDRDGKRKATFYLKEMEEDVYMAAKTLIEKGKHFDAVRMVIKNLWLGGDQPESINKNFVAMASAAKAVAELIAPLDADLKKN